MYVGNMKKNENFIISLILVLLLDLSMALYISQIEATKVINETFVIVCKDEGGASVQWSGPKGSLTGKTHPSVSVASYGTTILFNGTTLNDKGTYTCKSPTDSKTFVLNIEEPHIDRPYKQNRPLYTYNRENNKPIRKQSDKMHTNIKETDNDVADDSDDTDDDYYTDEPDEYDDNGDDNVDENGEAPLKFMDTKTEQAGMEGEDVTLRCEVESGKATWSIDGSDPTEPKYQVLGDGLVIKNVSREDSKTNYVCKAVQMSTGTIEERKINLTVYHPPSWANTVYGHQRQAWGYLGGYTNLTCEVEANPPAKIFWNKIENGKVKNVPGATTKVFSVSSTLSILQVFVNEHTLGTYKCTASNRHGKKEKLIKLDEGIKPQPPEFIELHGENSNLLDLGIRGPKSSEEESNRGMEVKWFNVEYRKVNSEEQWSNQEFNISEDNSYPLLDLHHDTEYEVRAASKNLAGLSDYTNSSFFKTLPSAADCVHLVLPKFYLILIAINTFIMPIYYLAV